MCFGHLYLNIYKFIFLSAFLELMSFTILKRHLGELNPSHTVEIRLTKKFDYLRLLFFIFSDLECYVSHTTC